VFRLCHPTTIISISIISSSPHLSPLLSVLSSWSMGFSKKNRSNQHLQVKKEEKREREISVSHNLPSYLTIYHVISVSCSSPMFSIPPPDIQFTRSKVKGVGDKAKVIKKDLIYYNSSHSISKISSISFSFFFIG